MSGWILDRRDEGRTREPCWCRRAGGRSRRRRDRRRVHGRLRDHHGVQPPRHEPAPAGARRARGTGRSRRSCSMCSPSSPPWRGPPDWPGPRGPRPPEDADLARGTFRAMVTQPDIVLFMTDQQRFDWIGSASEGVFETPFLDSLAASGVRFANAYSAATTCVPSRVSLLTGLHPHRVPVVEGTTAMQQGVWTIARGLREAGYETALIGRMHFKPMHADHGFDTLRICENINTGSGYGPDDIDDYARWMTSEHLPDWRLWDPGADGELAHHTGRQATGLPGRRRAPPDRLDRIGGGELPAIAPVGPSPVPRRVVPAPACAVRPTRALCLDVRPGRCRGPGRRVRRQ